MVLDSKMVGFHSKLLCFCGSDLQTGPQVLHVQDNIRGLVCCSNLIFPCGPAKFTIKINGDERETNEIILTGFP